MTHREHGSLLLVSLILIVLAAWWMSVALHTFSGAPHTATQNVPAPQVDTAYAFNGSLTVHEQAFLHGVSFSGTLAIPQCDTLAAGISQTGSAPVNTTLVLTVLKQDDPACTTQTTVQVPFTLAVSDPAAKPNLTRIELNSVAIPFTTASSTTNQQ